MPTLIDQPTPLHTFNGMILEIGINCGRDFAALVQPFSTNTGTDTRSSAQDIVNAFMTHASGPLQNCMSEDASIVFVEARGMKPGAFIPFREDFGIGALPGTRAAGLGQGQVACLVNMYCGRAAPGPSGKLQVAKAFIPGLADEDFTQDTVNPTVVSLCEAFESLCCSGLVGAANTWYRVGSATGRGPDTVPNVIRVDGMSIIATQRRRVVRTGA